MLIDLPLNKLLDRLGCGDVVFVYLNGFNVQVSIVDRQSRIALKTPVYMGYNYIPPSVRGGLSHRFNESLLRTFLTIDESSYQISLEYLESIDELTEASLKELLEEYIEEAILWRAYLDEKDRQDYVHIRAK